MVKGKITVIIQENYPKKILTYKSSVAFSVNFELSHIERKLQKNTHTQTNRVIDPKMLFSVAESRKMWRFIKKSK